MIKTKPVKMDGTCYLGKSPGSISFSNLALTDITTSLINVSRRKHYKREFTSVFSCDQMPPLSSGSVMLGILCILKQKKDMKQNRNIPMIKVFTGHF